GLTIRSRSAGIISEQERLAIVREAARSDCGKRNQVTSDQRCRPSRRWRIGEGDPGARVAQMTRDNRASPSASQERSMSLEPHRHNSKLSNFMQSARYVSGPVTELQ